VIIAAAIFYPKAVLADPRTWTVDDDGPADFRTIKDAINAAGSGDTVLVKPGKYYERVVVNKPISVTGESRETTIVDASGFGTALQISASGAAVSNFTITNAGRNWGPPPGQGSPDSAISVNGISSARIENNILFDAAVCIWITYSSSVKVADNIVLAGVYGGIIGYASSNLSILRNNVDNCGLMGLHLDGNSDDCVITENTVKNSLEGLELESGSSTNRIERNTFTDNNASVVLNKCGSRNSFRGNTMSSRLYNFILVGYNLEGFMQDIDSSNTVNNKVVYYLTNLRDQGISPLDYPNAGWLAIVNCTNVAIKDFNLFGNRDGVLVAYSTGCTLDRIIVGGNHKALLWGGFTFYSSNNNSMVGCQVLGSTIGLAFYQSSGNSFFRNYVDSERQVMSDFFTPFSNASSGHVSANIWDDGFEGNCWSDYVGMDENKDGIGDTPYIIDDQNVDHYPLISALPIVDTEPPIIWITSPYSGEVVRSSAVTISWEGADYASGISHYAIAIDDGYSINVGLNTSYTFTELDDGQHIVRITAFDNVGNSIYHLQDFVVNTGIERVSWPPYMVEAIGTIVVVITLGIAVYVLKSRYSFRIKKPSRKLVR
jgi:parallel beta-helix repeat protein